MEVKFASHCSYQIRYHQVYCVKYRKKLLRDDSMVFELKRIIRDICEQYWFEVDEIGTDGDHVHVFIGASPKESPSKIMQIVKSITAREMFKIYPELKKKLWGGQLWSDGGYIGTVGDGTNSEIVKKYIRNQGSVAEKENQKQLRLFKI